ncbi:hypothetical protein [Sporomusa sp. KB1]|uniref:hypothetical protein n=1 Tax=Sporomusa sp. KB1 TaxID=943346 RepID=UPI001C96F4B7|nr:hypothetical protein [Sporomusa sp. KB1]
MKGLINMDHSYLIKNVETPLSQQIEQAAQNDPEIKKLWSYVRLRQPGFISILGSAESDTESIKLLLQSLKHSHEIALADFKLHPHGNRQRNLLKAKELKRVKTRRDYIDYTLPDL